MDTSPPVEQARTTLPWRNLAVTLLNLTGLSLGYFYIRLWRRGALHLAVSILLLRLMSGLQADRHPIPWVIALVVWLAWMGFDGWRMANTPSPALLRFSRLPQYALLALPALLLLLEGAALLVYTDQFRKTMQLGDAAYQNGDCAVTPVYYYSVTHFYNLTLSPKVNEARLHLDECRLLVFGEQNLHGGNLTDAVFAFEYLLEAHPNSPLKGEAYSLAAESRLKLGEDLARQNRFPDAVIHYQTLEQRYADTEAALHARQNLPALLSNWSAYLAGGGDFQGAIDRLSLIQSEFPNAITPAEINRKIGLLYVDWGNQEIIARRYPEAIEHFISALPLLPVGGLRDEARIRMVYALNEHAGKFLQAGDFGGAIDQYLTIRNRFLAYPESSPAVEKGIQTYLSWVDSLRKMNEFAQAVKQMENLRMDFPEYPADLAKDKLASIYLSWGEYFETIKQYENAAEKYTLVKDSFSDVQVAQSVINRLVHVYLVWGEDLADAGEQLLALEKLAHARELAAGTQMLADAQDAYDQTLEQLARLSTGDGAQVLQDAFQQACNRKPVVSPAVALLVNEPKLGLLCNTVNAFELPDEMKAVFPGHFRYVISFEEGSDVIERKPYYTRFRICYGYCTPDYTLIRVQQWVKIDVVDVLTGEVAQTRTFKGPVPRAGEPSETFFSKEKTIQGGLPETSEILAWLKTYLR